MCIARGISVSGAACPSGGGGGGGGGRRFADERLLNPLNLRKRCVDAVGKIFLKNSGKMVGFPSKLPFQ